MATQTVEFPCVTGQTVTAKLFSFGSDTEVASVSATEATNRKGLYSAAFTDVAAGTARTNAANVGQVQDGGPLWGGTAGGTASADMAGAQTPFTLDLGVIRDGSIGYIDHSTGRTVMLTGVDLEARLASYDGPLEVSLTGESGGEAVALDLSLTTGRVASLRRREAEARQVRSKVLKPLKDRIAQLETKIEETERTPRTAPAAARPCPRPRSCCWSRIGASSGAISAVASSESGA